MKSAILPLLPALLLAACASQSPAPVVERTPSQATARPGTAPPESGRTHTVKRGETLYRIASDYGVHYRDLAAWNAISEPFAIREGQVLRVSPPGAATAGVVTQPVAVAAPVESRPLTASPPAAASGNVRNEPKVNKEAYSDGAWDRLQRSGEEAKAPAEPRAAEAKAAETKTPETKVEARPADGSGIVWAWPAAGKPAASFSESSRGIDIAGREGDPVLAAADGRVFFVGVQKGYGNLLIIGHANNYISVYAHNRKILVAEKQQVTRGQKVAEMGKSDSETGVKLHFEIRQQGKPVDPATFLPKR